MMNKRRLFIIGCAAISIFSLVANQFVVNKKNKGASVSALKQEACELLGRVLHHSPLTITKMADIQITSLRYVQECLSGDNNRLSTLSKTELQAIIKVLEEMELYLHSVNRKLDEYALFLQTLNPASIAAVKKTQS
jgi:hypothetical protein